MDSNVAGGIAQLIFWLGRLVHQRSPHTFCYLHPSCPAVIMGKCGYSLSPEAGMSIQLIKLRRKLNAKTHGALWRRLGVSYYKSSIYISNRSLSMSSQLSLLKMPTQILLPHLRQARVQRLLFQPGNLIETYTLYLCTLYPLNAFRRL